MSTITLNREIILTEEEARKIYKDYKRKLDIQEIRDSLDNMTVDTVLSACKFPYPGVFYLNNESKEKVVERILQNDNLMLTIYEKFWDNYDECSYDIAMRVAMENVLCCFGKENPGFLDEFETIDVVAYKKYQKDWFEHQNFSKEYIKELKERQKADYPNCTFEEYVEIYGFDGSLYVCIDEFRENEYRNVVYMNQILTKDEYLKYLFEEFEYVWYDIVFVNGEAHLERFPISGKMVDGHFQLDDFFDAVREKYGVKDVSSYMMDGMREDLLFRTECCGCYKHGALQSLDFGIKDREEKNSKNIEIVENLMRTLPDGFIRDADTVLYDHIDKASYDKFSGIANCIFSIWKKSNDKQALEEMFCYFTGCEFQDYVQESRHTMIATKMAAAVRDWLPEKSRNQDYNWLIEDLIGTLSVWSKQNLLRKDENQRADFYGVLIDQVEDFLCKFVDLSDIPCEDRKLAIKDGEDPDGLAWIYGEEYDYLASKFSEIISEFVD